MSGTIPPAGRIAGIDYGHVRIGIAVTDASRILASPLENYTRQSEKVDAEHFRTLAADEQLVGFVVGLPVHTSGAESAKSLEAREFGKWLVEQVGLPLEFHDERYTTADAEAILGGGQLTKKKRKARLDMLAAQIMLTGYLQSQRPGEPPEALED